MKNRDRRIPLPVVIEDQENTREGSPKASVISLVSIYEAVLVTTKQPATRPFLWSLLIPGVPARAGCKVSLSLGERDGVRGFLTGVGFAVA